MSVTDHEGPDSGGDDIFAAEYVVGALSAEERRRAEARIESDPAFARLVEQWEERLSPLADGYVPVNPPASAKAALDRRLFSTVAVTGTAPRAQGAGFWRSLALWRGLAAAAVVALVVALAVPLIRPSAPPAPQYVASLAASGSDVRYLAYYNEQTGSVSLSHVSGERARGRDFELWAIEGKNKPIALGVIPAGQSVSLPIDKTLRDRISGGWVIAISVEPLGGSPTGQPTGPVVATGDLRKI